MVVSAHWNQAVIRKNSIVLNVHILKAWPWKLSQWSIICTRLRIRVMHGRSEDRSMNWILLWFWCSEICGDHQLLLKVNKSNSEMDEQNRKTAKKWNVVEKMLVAPTSKAYCSKLGKTKSGFVSNNKFWYLKHFCKFPSSKWY